MTATLTPANGFPEGFQKVCRAAEDLGAKVLYTPEESEDHSCPFNLHLLIRLPDTIVVDSTMGAPLEPHIAGLIIHELGHLIVNRDTTSPEFDFMGWEFAVAQKYNILEEWLLGSKDYTVDDDGTEFGSLTPKESSELLEERLKRAVELGYIVNGEPIGM
jgi:hypothetical protein